MTIDQSGSDVYVSLEQSWNNFGDFLTFSSESPNFNSSHALVYDQIAKTHAVAHSTTPPQCRPANTPAEDYRKVCANHFTFSFHLVRIHGCRCKCPHVAHLEMSKHYLEQWSVV